MAAAPRYSCHPARLTADLAPHYGTIPFGRVGKPSHCKLLPEFHVTFCRAADGHVTTVADSREVQAKSTHDKGASRYRSASIKCGPLSPVVPGTSTATLRLCVPGKVREAVFTVLEEFRDLLLKGCVAPRSPPLAAIGRSTACYRYRVLWAGLLDGQTDLAILDRYDLDP